MYQQTQLRGAMSKNAVVTGAGRGIGWEFTKQLAKAGNRVVATVRDKNRYPELLKLAESSNVYIVELDTSYEGSIKRAPFAIEKHIPRVDLLVNNAGVNAKSNRPYSQESSLKLGLLEQESLLNHFKINAIGPLLVTQALLPLLKNASKPKIVNISSWLGSISNKTMGGNYGYCGSKAALNMFNRALAHDLKEYGILTVNFNPGWVKTDMGGPKGDLDPIDSVKGILSSLNSLSPNDSGKFYQWNSTEYPW